VPVTPAVFSANINQWATGASAEKTYQIDDLSVTCAQETVLLCNCNCVTLPINRKSDATVGLVVMIV
jgi:hypothetical protein